MCFIDQCVVGVYLTTLGPYTYFPIYSDGAGISPHSGDKDRCFGKVLSDKAGLFLSPDVITVKFRLAWFSPSLNNVFSNSRDIHSQMPSLQGKGISSKSSQLKVGSPSS